MDSAIQSFVHGGAECQIIDHCELKVVNTSQGVGRCSYMFQVS